MEGVSPTRVISVEFLWCYRFSQVEGVRVLTEIERV